MKAVVVPDGAPLPNIHYLVDRDGRRPLDQAYSIEIEEEEAEGGDHVSGYLLFRYRCDGGLITDTWHASIQSALDQALFEYGIEESAWVAIPPTDEAT